MTDYTNDLRADELEFYAGLIEEGSIPAESGDPVKLRETAARLRAEQARVTEASRYCEVTDGRADRRAFAAGWR